MSAPSSERGAARIAVIGAGLVGVRHAEIAAAEGFLTAIADPAPTAGSIGERLGVPVYSSVETLLAEEAIDGAIVATPNQRHLADGLACIGAGVAALIEKPIAGSTHEGEALVAAAEAAGAPLLVGHHRRHNPIIRAAKAVIQSGRIGDVVTAQSTCWLRKPDDYFDTAWRRMKGAGPVLINLIHDVELMLHFCGPVAEVQAIESRATRDFEVEDAAAALLSFESGAIGTISVTDAAATPWSWELTAGENPAYPKTDAFAYAIGGTKGGLSVPDLSLWSHEGDGGWWTPMRREALEAAAADPLILQIRHFAEVATGRATPLVTGREGLAALRVVEAVKRSAASRRPETP